jgi:hypothetical protein
MSTGAQIRWRIMRQITDGQTYIPASSGHPLGFFKSMTMPDGRVVNIFAGKPD